MSEKNGRLSKDDYYLNIAKAVSARSTCLRRKFGAIIVRDDSIVSTGYNGPARGVVNCMDVGCLKNETDAPEFERYDLCTAVHAEENCIINAARHGVSVLGGTLYIYGEYSETGELTEADPCYRCRRALINSGIEMVVVKRETGNIKKIDISSWIEEDSEKYIKRLEDTKK